VLDRLDALLVGLCGYIVSALALVAVLSVLLQAGTWQTMLLGQAADKLSMDKSLPAPFIATLAMTTLLSSVPVLKRIEGFIRHTGSPLA
jgi:hypothetical protein